MLIYLDQARKHLKSEAITVTGADQIEKTSNAWFDLTVWFIVIFPE